MKNSDSNTSPIVPKALLVPFIMLVSCFALWGLLNNMTDTLVPAFSKIFTINAKESAGVQISFYGAYAVLAIFASILIKEFTYKTGVLVGLGFYMIGALFYIPAALNQSFDIYLIAIFILAGGLSVLETTCNPFVLSMGSPETAVRRLNLAQSFNPVGSLLGIIIAKFAILSNLHEAEMEERVALKANDPEQLKEIIGTELFWVCVPYVSLVLIALLIWGYFVKFKQPQASHIDEDHHIPFMDKIKRLSGCVLFTLIPIIYLIIANQQFGISYSMVTEILITMIGPIVFLVVVPYYRHMLMALLRLKRYYFGVITQFFYVGLQITVWTWTIKYIMTVAPSYNEDGASTYYLLSLVMFFIFRFGFTMLMKKFNPAVMMTLAAIAGIALSLAVMYLPASISIWCLVGISGCMSLMFPTIYGIALQNLGEEVKLGAAGLIMAILGGAVITPYMGGLIDSGELSYLVTSFSHTEAAVRSSFVVPIVCFTVILIYSLCFKHVHAKQD